MPDSPDNLLPPPPATPEPTLFDSTSVEAGRVAARFAKTRYRQILIHLRDVGPACIFEIAAALSVPGRQVFDNQISGRFSRLEQFFLIAKTGERRKKPATGCSAEVYAITTIGLAAAGNVAQPPPAVDSNAVQIPETHQRVGHQGEN